MKPKFFKDKFRLSLSLCFFLYASVASADSVEVDGLTIAKVRAVGSYSDPTYNNTLEIWFNTPITWPASITCANLRVEIDATQKHLVAAAFLALSTGKKVNIYVDTTLPIRGSICQISFIDVVA